MVNACSKESYVVRHPSDVKQLLGILDCDWWVELKQLLVIDRVALKQLLGILDCYRWVELKQSLGILDFDRSG